MDYGSVAKAIAHRLKYGRRIGLAEVMGAHMARLLQDPEPDSLLLPVPLHRWRIWSRGFNQAALVAREIGRRQNLPVALDLLRRTRNTPPFHSQGRAARARIVRGAFALAPDAGALLRGRTAILVDDIWTTGATIEACCRLLRRGGAARVEVVCWARVPPSGD